MNEPNANAPLGQPIAVFLEGILDGRVADGAALSVRVRELGTAGAGAFRCDVRGGRFSLLPNETQLAEPDFDEAKQARFLDALQQLIATAQPGSVETNLRCRMVYADEVAETLFVVRGDRIEPLTRRRPRTPADNAGIEPQTAPLPGGLGRRELLILVPVLLVLGAFFAWNGGWIDRVLAARAEGMQVDNGPFDAMLAVQCERSWGNYAVKLGRGADYPTSPQALAERKAAQSQLDRSAACDAVGNGGTVFVQLLDDAGVVLAESRVELRPLLTAPDGEAKTTLPGRMLAKGLRLSISKRPDPK
jgi:hypothetical protein